MNLNTPHHLNHSSILQKFITPRMFLALSLPSTSHSPSPPEKPLISFAPSLTSISLIKLFSTTPRLPHSTVTGSISNLKALSTAYPPAMKPTSRLPESLLTSFYLYRQRALKLRPTTSLTLVTLKMLSSPCVKPPEPLIPNKK
jgi:hypothetical protein